MFELQHLIAEAQALAGEDICAAGHAWESEAGRRCPRFEDQINCSQTVYRCARCGSYDYGDIGGPAHRECFDECPHEWRFV